MDSLTHIVLGACIGEVVAGKRLGKKAMFWGILTQSLPDIDFVASFWMNPANDLLAHRGFTHSFLFIALVAPLLALAADRWHRPHNYTWRKWTLFFALEMLVHVVLDACNAYGTGWFEPFSHYRVSFNLLFVADPLFSIWPFIAFMVLLFSRTNYAARRKWAIASFILSAAYIGISVINKTSVDRAVKAEAQHQGIAWKRYFSTPTPLNNMLWFVVLEDEKGFYTGHRSVWDKGPDTALLHYKQRHEDYLEPVKDVEDLHRLIRFSQGYYIIDKYDSTLVFNDLRFGQMLGWQDPEARFVFHYFLQKPDENSMVIQRGRFTNWNKEAVSLLFRRMRGLK
ncbi:metal-dependent hydrolase [Paraflavitalea soli]|uniref:Metal-dependent hydrolase n=1 Tax=Paraflavitalea soli TaxID=2315862 RepID=A0A3B7MMF2_9BACT|nr:metal-dependent hydrolase [Paraflavitalea soli]AXY75694.1 metal-dependent hydrolase [Paraflavitalea soli]